jgi:hypothetical protein
MEGKNLYLFVCYETDMVLTHPHQILGKIPIDRYYMFMVSLSIVKKQQFPWYEAHGIGRKKMKIKHILD